MGCQPTTLCSLRINTQANWDHQASILLGQTLLWLAQSEAGLDGHSVGMSGSAYVSFARAVCLLLLSNRF